MPGDLAKRARIAFYRSLVRHGERLPLSSPVPVMITHEETTYVLLRSGPAILAVYKVTSTGTLQRQHHWPQALEECVEHSCSR